jgi:hypothetical protein
MINLVFLDTNNVVMQLLVFDTYPSEESLAEFKAVQEDLLGVSPLRVVKDSDYEGVPFIGGELYQEQLFRELRPYPSWLWNLDGMEWIAPTIKPTIEHEVGDLPTYFYNWDEPNLRWVREDAPE